MRPVTAVALFCEDIREEKAGTDSIVGIMPDNVEVGTIPGTFMKVAIYVRVQLDPSMDDPGPISLELRMANGDIQVAGSIAPEIVTKSLADTRQQKGPLASFILRAMLINLPVKTAGQIHAVLKYGKEETLCGFINVIAGANPTPTA